MDNSPEYLLQQLEQLDIKLNECIAIVDDRKQAKLGVEIAAKIHQAVCRYDLIEDKSTDISIRILSLINKITTVLVEDIFHFDTNRVTARVSR